MMKTLKPRKEKFSLSYVDEFGNLKIQYHFVEKLWIQITKPLCALPFMVSFILCCLWMVEILCLVGLAYELRNPKEASNLGIYIFLMVAIGIISTLGFGMGWCIAEQNEANKQRNASKSTSHQENNKKDRLND